MTMHLRLLLIVLASLTFMTGCEDEEISAISEAQQCLDDIPADVDAAEDAAGLNGELWLKAQNCANKVAKYNSQQANIIKCGAYLTGGGLDTARIVGAAKELNDEESNSEAIYLAALTLNKPNDSTNTDLANRAQQACNATEIDSYIFIGNMAATGTALSAALGGIGFPDDPTSISPTDIENAIDNCVGDTSCVETIAGSVTTIAESYCSNDSSADEGVCEDINSAIESAGGSSAAITESLLCLLNGEAENCVP